MPTFKRRRRTLPSRSQKATSSGLFLLSVYARTIYVSILIWKNGRRHRHVAGGRVCESNVPPTSGPGEEIGRARARPSCVRADTNQAKKWTGNGSAGGWKRTRVRLGRRVGLAFLSPPIQTGGRRRKGSPHCSCSKCLIKNQKRVFGYIIYKITSNFQITNPH